MTTATTTVQVHQVYIKANSERIWEAITQPTWNQRYEYATPGTYDLRPWRTYQSTPSDATWADATERGIPLPDVIVDGEVVEVAPSHKLVQTWRLLVDPATAAEGTTRLTFEIAAMGNGASKLTLTHDLSGAPILTAMVSRERERERGGAAGPGSSATSRRSWKPAPRSRTNLL